MTAAPTYAYDVFISHNRADKAWARELAAWLSDQQYNGRSLRPWLDEQFLDPGALGSTLELTTALDRSRLLGLVLSPEALASSYVDLELEYFLGSRDADHVIAMLRRDCRPPEAVTVPALDFRADGLAEGPRRQLLVRLCPPTATRPDQVERAVDAAFDQLEASDPGGFAPGTTLERDAVFAELLRHDIDENGAEGLALAGFARAAGRVLRACAHGSRAAYTCKMLLGECLAAALHRSPAYRQVARRFLDLAAAQAGDPVLLFVVARAYSKLAEMDPRLVDTSVLLRAVSQLDAAPPGNEVRAIEALFARVVGKLRDTPAGELLIKALTERGRASRIVAAGGISLSYQRSEPVFYVSELRQLHDARKEEHVLPAGRPSKRLLGELFTLDLDQDDSVRNAVRLAREDILDVYPDTDFPYGASWFLRRHMIQASSHHTPFTGTVVKATRQNMTALAGRVEVSAVACLTEPRIVDALFDGCGALLVEEQDADSPQCRRLRSRRVPFAMASEPVMAQLADGDHVVVDDTQVRVLKTRGV
jgi:hypothetical protein